MNKDQYIYGSSRVAALEAKLLSESQVERMISAKSADEAFLALNDTFLAPYIAGQDRSYLPLGLRKSVSATKRLICDIAPNEDIFDVLWLHYDFFNLKTVIKGVAAGLSDEQLHDRCFYSGKYQLDVIIAAVRGDDAQALPHPELVRAYREAQGYQHVYQIDYAMDKGYFRAIHAVAKELNDAYITRYVTIVTDFFNLETQLRLVRLPEVMDRDEMFVEGGTIRHEELDTEAHILEAFQKYGDAEFWQEAVEAYAKTNDYAILSKAIDDYIVRVTKETSRDLFSLGPLFGYFLAHRNNTQIVQTIMAAKESSMQESELRRILRRLYA